MRTAGVHTACCCCSQLTESARIRILCSAWEFYVVQACLWARSLRRLRFSIPLKGAEVSPKQYYIMSIYYCFHWRFDDRILPGSSAIAKRGNEPNLRPESGSNSWAGKPIRRDLDLLGHLCAMDNDHPIIGTRVRLSPCSVAAL